MSRLAELSALLREWSPVKINGSQPRCYPVATGLTDYWYSA